MGWFCDRFPLTDMKDYFSERWGGNVRTVRGRFQNPCQDHSGHWCLGPFKTSSYGNWLAEIV